MTMHCMGKCVLRSLYDDTLYGEAVLRPLRLPHGAGLVAVAAVVAGAGAEAGVARVCRHLRAHATVLAGGARAGVVRALVS